MFSVMAVARSRVLTCARKGNASGSELCAVGFVSQRLTRPYLLPIWAQGIIPLAVLRWICGNSKLDEEARKDTIKQHVREMTILNELNKSIDAIRRQRSIQGCGERASGCFELDLVLLGLHDRLWKPAKTCFSDLLLTSGDAVGDALLAVASCYCRCAASYWQRAC